MEKMPFPLPTQNGRKWGNFVAQVFGASGRPSPFLFSNPSRKNARDSSINTGVLVARAAAAATMSEFVHALGLIQKASQEYQYQMQQAFQSRPGLWEHWQEKFRTAQELLKQGQDLAVSRNSPKKRAAFSQEVTAFLNSTTV